MAWPRRCLLAAFTLALLLLILACNQRTPSPTVVPSATSGVSGSPAASAPVATSSVGPGWGGQIGAPIVIGIEYAFPGTASVFAETGITGVKPFPEGFTRWEKMQPDLDKPVDFSALDAFVREYQEAGLTDIIFGIRYDHSKASVAATTGGSFFRRASAQPKPEYLDAFDRWLTAFVERYDGDGVDDMPGLVAGVRYWEFGVEYSSYVPEPGEEYVSLLEGAYRVMHEAGGDEIVVAHAAFFVAGPLEAVTDPSQYPGVIAGGPDKIKTKRYDEIELVLARPDLTDVWNVHSLGDPSEIDQLVRWLRWEEEQRGITPKPIIVSDTSTNPYVAFGVGTTCSGLFGAIPIYPATAEDHCRVAEYFKTLVAGDAAAEAFARKQAAEDIVKKVVIAASDGVVLFNAAFTEDIEALKSGVLGVGIPAGAGFGGWAGIVEVQRNATTQERTVQGRYPGFYALWQLTGHLDGHTAVRRADVGDDHVRLYSIDAPGGRSWIAWFDPKTAVLPGDVISHELALPGVSGTVTVEPLITSIGQTEAESYAADPAAIELSDTPVFISE